MDLNLEHIKQKVVDFFTSQQFINIIIAIVILVVGMWIAKKVSVISKKIMSKSGLDITLQNFLGDLFNWTLKILVIITAISQAGVQTTSFVAILGAASLAIGLSLQGSLGNLAGGVLVMLFKPFRVGDLVEAQGQLGVVKEIQIFVTKLVSLENKLIIIPNGAMSNGTIVNYTEEGQLRVDLTFGVGYGEDIKKVKDVFMKVMKTDSRVLESPEPTVNLLELGDSSINFAVRPWTKPEDYWDVYFNITEQAKEALDREGIEIPYPHQVEIKKTIS